MGAPHSAHERHLRSNQVRFARFYRPSKHIYAPHSAAIHGENKAEDGLSPASFYFNLNRHMGIISREDMCDLWSNWYRYEYGLDHCNMQIRSMMYIDAFLPSPKMKWGPKDPRCVLEKSSHVMDGRADRREDGQTDRPSYKDTSIPIPLKGALRVDEFS